MGRKPYAGIGERVRKGVGFEIVDLSRMHCLASVELGVLGQMHCSESNI